MFAGCTTAVGLAAERLLGWPPSAWAPLMAGGTIFTTLFMLAKARAATAADLPVPPRAAADQLAHEGLRAACRLPCMLAGRDGDQPPSEASCRILSLPQQPPLRPPAGGPHVGHHIPRQQGHGPLLGSGWLCGCPRPPRAAAGVSRGVAVVPDVCCCCCCCRCPGARWLAARHVWTLYALFSLQRWARAGVGYAAGGSRGGPRHHRHHQVGCRQGAARQRRPCAPAGYLRCAAWAAKGTCDCRACRAWP